MTRRGLYAEAIAAFNELPGDCLYQLPKSYDYVATLAYFAEFVVDAGLRNHAEKLYPLLGPYPRLCVVASSFHCSGTVARILGRLAELIGRPDEAAAHFDLALSDCARHELLAQLAITHYDYARLLERASVRRRDAIEFSRRAGTLAAGLGMKPLAVASSELHSFLSGGHEHVA
jgi:hypothetical protein